MTTVSRPPRSVPTDLALGLVVILIGIGALASVYHDALGPYLIGSGLVIVVILLIATTPERRL